MFVEAMSLVFDRGKRPDFFLSFVPCLWKGSALMGLHWLLLGQRFDFKMRAIRYLKFFIARLPYIYVSIREPLSYYRPGENLLSLQTLKFMSIVLFPLLLQNC